MECYKGIAQSTDHGTMECYKGNTQSTDHVIMECHKGITQRADCGLEVGGGGRGGEKNLPKALITLAYYGNVQCYYLKQWSWYRGAVEMGQNPPKAL